MPEFRNATVIGAGVMGSGIAQTLAVAGLVVTCCDIDEAQLDKARDSTANGRYGLGRAVERGYLAADDAVAAAARLTFSVDADAAVAQTDLLIEAIPEKLDMKVDLFRHHDAIAPSHAIFASNTSGLPIVRMAEATRRPPQVIGWHWSSPAAVMKMAEVVVAPATSDEVRDAIVELAKRCGKVPVVVRDNPDTWGHVGNRIYAAIGKEARAILEEGLVDAEGLDLIMTTGWGWPAGPIGMGRGARQGWGQSG